MNRDSVSTSEVISQLRLPLIVLVTFAHSYGGVAPGYSLIGSGWDSYEVLKLFVSQTLVKVVVPVFFMISGYLFFRNVETWSLQVYWGKIRRRLWTLLLPYVAWNLLMAVKLHFLNFSISHFLNISFSQSLIFSFSQSLIFSISQSLIFSISQFLIFSISQSLNLSFSHFLNFSISPGLVCRPTG